MGEDKKTNGNFEDLRRRAEGSVRDVRLDQDVSKLSEQDVRALAHELQVHQAELEIQNEELRRAQIELQESRDKYADLYDFSPVGYFTLDRHGVILEANLSGARLVSHERRSLIKKPFILLVSEDDHRTFFSHMARVFGRSFKQTCEIRLKGPDQNWIYARLESIAAPSEGGALEVCRVAVSDISEVKRTHEEALMTRDQVLTNMAEGVSVCNLEGVISFTNAAFCPMFDHEPGGLLQKNLFELEDCFEGERAAVLPGGISQALTTGYWRGEVPACKKNGERFEANVRISVLELFENKSLITVWEDITDLKYAERSLRESEQRFRAIFEGAQDLIFLKDRSLKYTHVNPAFANLFGKEPADIVGFKYEDLHGAEGAAYEKDLDSRVLGGQTLEEERVSNINGISRRFDEVRTPLRDREGKVSGLCAIARDVTERRKLQLQSSSGLENVRSRVMQQTLLLALKAATMGSVVLLQGESGTGKDYMARFIHDHSNRSGGPYFSINCAAIPHELAESELFGHERGAFTGAHARKRGLLELAEGGTLLLNEIGDLPLLLQAKLLTFLDTKRFTRVGGENEISVNARLMFATNRDLEKDVEAGGFRTDLFYRINVMTITIPPLRDRIEDIPVLAREIMPEIAKDLQLTEIPPIDPASQVALTGYDWPGNVRELRNVLERSLMLSEGESLKLTLPALTASAQAWSITSTFPLAGRTLHDVTDEVIDSLCREALRRAGSNRRRAARILGISRDSLYRYLKRFGLERENRTTDEVDA